MWSSIIELVSIGLLTKSFIQSTSAQMVRLAGTKTTLLCLHQPGGRGRQCVPWNNAGLLILFHEVVHVHVF